MTNVKIPRYRMSDMLLVRDKRQIKLLKERQRRDMLVHGGAWNIWDDLTLQLQLGRCPRIMVVTIQGNVLSTTARGTDAVQAALDCGQIEEYAKYAKWSIYDVHCVASGMSRKLWGI